jgi:hypothetical protein
VVALYDVAGLLLVPPYAKEAVYMRRVALVLGVAAIMVVMAASSSTAAKPVIDEGTFTGTVVLGDCGDFQVLDQFVLNFRAKLFFDENGELVRIVEQINGTDTFINSQTGKEFTSRFQNTEHIDLTAGPVRTVTGVQGLLTVPGSGAVLLDVGRIVTNLETDEVTFQAGPHQLVEGDLAGLCEALAP